MTSAAGGLGADDHHADDDHADDDHAGTAGLSVASVIPAAGTLPWRREAGRLQVAIVHRPKYDDWSWPKGKLDPGEQPCVAAARETDEETGLEVRLGVPLPSAEYPVLDPRGGPATKQVRYWAATVTGGSGALLHEIDDVAWVDVPGANDRLDYTRDRDQLLALVRADREGALDTWPLAIVRHAKSRPRGSWTGDDRLRPLDAVGFTQARSVAEVLGAYGVSRVVSSTSLRCVQTIEPYAAQLALPVKSRECLSEEGFAADPSGATRQLEKVLKRAEPTVICSHGPVLPTLLDGLASRVGACGTTVAAELGSAADGGLRKGEVLLAHVAGRGKRAHVVAVERVNT